MLDIVIISPKEIIFKGQAKSIVLPGDNGVFQVLPFHKRLLSRLLCGHINVDGQLFKILRGVVKVERNKVTAVVEAGETGSSS